MSDDVLFAHAALVVSNRVKGFTVADAVEYLYATAHDTRVNSGELARMIVQASETRSQRWRRQQSAPVIGPQSLALTARGLCAALPEK